MTRRLILLLFVLFVVLTGCKESPSPETQGHTPGPLPENSLYQLEGEWETGTGEKVALADFRGKVQMVSMIYTTCQGACPRIVADMKALQEAMSEQTGGEIEFLLVTMDPENDNPEALQRFAEEQRLGPEWRLVRGSENQTQEISAVLNSKYRKLEGSTDFAHSNLITILNKDGVIIHQQEGLGVPVEGGVEVLEGLVTGTAPCCQ